MVSKGRITPSQTRLSLALAARIARNHPELIRSLTEIGKYAGLASLHPPCSIPCLEDIATKPHQILDDQGKRSQLELDGLGNTNDTI